MTLAPCKLRAAARSSKFRPNLEQLEDLICPTSLGLVTQNDSYAVTHGKSIPSLNLLANDTISVTGTTNVEIVSQPTMGYLVSNPSTGEWSYSAPMAMTGIATFQYRLIAGTELSTVATVSIQIENSAPTASLASISVAHGKSATINLSALVSDADGDAPSISILQQPSHGSVWYDSWNGKFQYYSYSNFVGNDSFVFQASDGIATSSPASVAISVTNEAPVATPPAPISVLHGRSVEINLSSLVSDADGDFPSFQIMQQPAHGSLWFNSWTGTYQYSSNFNYSGSDTFAFRVSDGVSQSGTVEVPINVTNAAPTIAIPEERTLLHGRSISLDLKSYASDADGDWLNVQLVNQPHHGWIWYDSWTGAYQYSANSSYVGEDSFAFKANDGVADSEVVVVPIQITNTAPVVTSPAPSLVRHGGSIEFDLQACVTDADGDFSSIAIAQQPLHGSLWFNSWSGRYVYSANYGYSGADSFAFSASDGASQSNTAVVAINVTNTAPTAIAPTAIDVLHGKSVEIDLRPKVSDADGDWLNIVITQQPSHGWLSFDGWSGNYRYYPSNSYVGEDSFSFAASDGIATSAPVSVSLNVTNHVPEVGEDRSYVLGKGQSVSGINFLAGAFDADQDWLSAEIVDQPDHGTLAYDWMSNSYTYYPQYGFTGNDEIKFRVWDGAHHSEIATATLSVVAPSISLMVESVTASLLRISGRVAGYHSANAFVELHGAANLSAVADADGYFSVETNVFSLGDLGAFAWTPDGIQSDATSVLVSAPPPQFSAFTATNNGDNAWTISGHVDDVFGQLLAVSFSGISSVATKQAYLDAMGNFTLSVELAANEGGLLFASICDRWGRNSGASFEIQA